MGAYEYTNQPPVADAGADQTVTADTSCRAVVALDGTHMITLTVRDRRGGSSSDTLVVSVVDATPPVIQSAVPTPSVLWPVKRQVVDVTIAASASLSSPARG